VHSIVRCPRCGGQRLVQLSLQGILVLCVGCGLLTTELELPPPPALINVGDESESIGRRQSCRHALPTCDSVHMLSGRL
jgi:hypothetical protein